MLFRKFPSIGPLILHLHSVTHMMWCDEEEEVCCSSLLSIVWRMLVWPFSLEPFTFLSTAAAAASTLSKRERENISHSQYSSYFWKTFSTVMPDMYLIYSIEKCRRRTKSMKFGRGEERERKEWITAITWLT